MSIWSSLIIIPNELSTIIIEARDEKRGRGEEGAQGHQGSGRWLSAVVVGE